jgi:hypothetical protein
MRLNQPIVGMAATPTGGGYWLVARDGGIFSFGDARFFGSTGAMRLNQPIVGMAATPTAKGYWLVAADGGIFSFGDASFRGSAGANPLPKPVIGLITAPGGAAGISEQSGGLNPYPSGSLGYDVSWPQCGGNLPARTDGPAIVGVNGGRSFTANPCFASQAAWAGDALNVYVNTNAPNGTTASRGDTGPAGACAATDTWCRSYNYGFNAAQWSVASAAGAGAHPQVWWLDVETGNVWSSDQIANAKVVSGFIDGLHAYGLTVGIYSTSYQWGVIAGGYRPGLPGWVATGGTSNPAAYCSPVYALTEHRSPDDARQVIEHIKGSGQLVMESVTHLRGRTLHNSFVLVDEAQNLPPDVVKTILTRIGEDSKVVFTGDTSQIDAAFLSEATCGLSVLIGALGGNDLFGHVRLTKGERSRVAEVAAALL